MKKLLKDTDNNFSTKQRSEQGAALVIAILVMLLLMAFVAVVVSRVSVETVITANDASENRSLAAAQAGLEIASRDFADVSIRKLNPTTTDISEIESAEVPGFTDYTFTKKVTVLNASKATEITGGTYSGLYSLRDEWMIDSTALDPRSGVETQVRRSFINDRIPLYQFGMFFEDDLELNRPPLFTFGGRVHTNSNFFVTAFPVASGGGIYFKSKATAHGEVVNDIWKTGTSVANGTDNQNGVFVADAGGTFRELMTGQGSVKCVSPSGTNVFSYDANLPYCSKLANWATNKQKFQGNLEANTPRLDLPLYRLGIDLVELVKRGKNVGDTVAAGTGITNVASNENGLVARERFANKPGLRISLADAKNRLPGCATVTAACGVQLDQPFTVAPGYTSIGYQPLQLRNNYRATRFNATRLAQNGKQIWIKVEMVDFDYDTNLPVTTDITEDILSLGVTERAPVTTDFKIKNYGTPTDNENKRIDGYSIIKLQRFTMPGDAMTNPTGVSYLSPKTIGGTNHNMVVRYNSVNNDPTDGCLRVPIAGISLGNCGTAQDSFSPPMVNSSSSSNAEDFGHLEWATTNGGGYDISIVPFPIEMFDTREGIPNDSTTWTNQFGTDKVPSAGVMSMVDIDVKNLRRFLMGDFDTMLPNGTKFATGNGRPLRSSDVPSNRGWIVYVSDRRGDADFDGQYDMEDIFPDNVLQYNEDVNKDNLLNMPTGLASGEAPNYYDAMFKTAAASSDHGYYRRGVRLINAEVVPGEYLSSAPQNTRGFTFASENGVYIKGNLNATSVTLSGSTAPAPSQNYFPQNTTTHIPTAVASDAVTILSNAWNDSKSFNTPFNPNSRTASPTVVRFAMLTGDGITGKTSGSNYNPSSFGQLNGGVHNFKRFLETWSNVRLNYSGSLVNLFTSQNNNGYWKCCNAVYNPPIRDWSFDTTFLDANRLPPGTPYIYSMSFTGFQRVND